MRARYSKTVLFVSLCAVFFAVVGALLLLFAFGGEIGGAITMGALLLFACAGLYFYFRFGLFIGKKWVTVYDGDTFKRIRYEEIDRITVIFASSSMQAEIRVHSKEYGWGTYEFCWEAVRTLRGRRANFRQYLLYDEEFVNRSIESLSNCEKVQIRDLYHLGK